MQTETLKLKEGAEYIELLQLLKFKQIAQTGGHAKIIVEDGLVTVNGEQEFRKRRKLRPGDVIQVEENIIEIA